MDRDEAEFSALYARHAPDVYRFALYLCGDRAEAEDITSETFVRVWTSAEPVRAATVKAYLLTIARNVYLHDRRRERRRATLPENVADARPTPDLVAEQLDELAAVRARLAMLSEVDRSALLMASVDGVAYKDIATALGLSLPAVKVRIHRARLALLAHLRSEAP